MDLRCDALWAEKRGVEVDEWEDGFAFDADAGRAAVADGASSAVASADWAQQLTRSWLDDPAGSDHGSMAEWLARCQAVWAAEQPSDSVPDDAEWWVSSVSGQPTFATLVTVSIAAVGHAWEVTGGAIGDAVVVHLRDGERLSHHPEIGPDDFGVHPDLVSTDADHLERAVDSYGAYRWAAADGDTLMLITDALAEWALRLEPAEPEVWTVLAEIGPAGFRAMIDAERSADRLVNDDVTLLRMKLGAVE